ncbi:MAG TPA: DUF3301 domain-containing protein [Casimicrobiaceae bacterium]|nr:DUF3301 domain-containing protein [Casimicrobiaceae bacterium]
MTLSEILGLLLIAGIGWFVWDSMKIREAANAAMRAACESRGMYFLDDTVALQSIKPVRNDAGRIVLRRIYDFEYSDTGHNRRKGSITLVADAVVALDVGLRLVGGSEFLQ